MTKPGFWPDGCDVAKVRACNCGYCEELLEAYEAWQEGQAIDGENQTLERFA